MAHSPISPQGLAKLVEIYQPKVVGQHLPRPSSAAQSYEQVNEAKTLFEDFVESFSP
jgi:hypothetical protein